MIDKLFKTSPLFPLVFLLSSCLPPPLPYPPHDVTEVTESTIESLATKSSSRKDIIKELGKPLRYRKNEISYLVCREEGGFGWALYDRLSKWERDETDISGDIECTEFILAFDAQDNLRGFRKIPYTWPLNEKLDLMSEDLYLRELGKQGDPIAQQLWEKSRTYYTSQRKDIVEERIRNEQAQVIRKKELAAKLKPRAESGDAKAQFELYFLEGNVSFKWLCRAADQRYKPAEKYLGYLFETGSNGVPQDYAQAYVWYHRAAFGTHQQKIEKMIKELEKKDTKPTYCFGKEDQCYIAEKIVYMKVKLGSKGVSRAEIMLEQWKPGKCEAELSSTESVTGVQ